MMGISDSSIIRTYKDFERRTTSHGISHIGRSKSFAKKMIWLISLIASTGGLIFNIYRLSADFASFKVTTVLESRQSKGMDFPAVTICNSNPLQEEQLEFETKKYLDEYRKYMNSFTCAPALLSRSCIVNCTMNCTKQDMNEIAEEEARANLEHSDCMSSMNFTTKTVKREDVVIQNYLIEKISLQLTNKNKNLEENLKKIIKDCVIGGKSCLLKMFRVLKINYYGICYTFNSVVHEGKPLRSHYTGPDHGLSITFNSDQSEYIGELAQSAGLRVVVHDPSRMPYPEDEGILVSSGFRTHIGITTEIYEKLNGQYDNCTDPKQNTTSKTMYQKLYNVTYRKKDCIYTCLHEIMMDRCGCTDIKFPFQVEKLHFPCSAIASDKVQCIRSVWDDYEEERIDCMYKCPETCRQMTFKSIISSELWPSIKFKQMVSNSSQMNWMKNEFISKTRNGGMFLVYFQDFDSLTIGEQPSYEIYKFISDIGGALGLYVGFSILTVMEFFELLIDLLGMLLFPRASGRRRKHLESQKVADEFFEPQTRF